MTQIHGVYWPDTVGTQYEHALMHVAQSLEVSLARCLAQGRTRTAVQAGGNVGLWPRRMAEVFRRVFTFEPDVVSFECLTANAPSSVLATHAALGEHDGRCSVSRKNLGSHKVIAGDAVPMVRLDSLGLDDLDLLQLDVEGYEWPALKGAAETLDRCRPIVHVELRDEVKHRVGRTRDVVLWLQARGYRHVATAQGCDAIFEVAR